MEKFSVRFATTENELTGAYKLRFNDMLMQYRSDAKSENGLDITPCDAYARQVICVDNETNEVVGCYRMITDEDLPKGERFVSEEEFNIDTLKSYGEKTMELSRAVVKTEYRNSAVLPLLLRFIVQFIRKNNYRFVIGDASFFGVDKSVYARELAYLANNYGIDEKYNVYSLQDDQIDIDSAEKITDAEARKLLPALLKVYTAFGAMVSKTAFSDYDFGSVDVFILLDTKKCNDAYINRLLRI